MANGGWFHGEAEPACTKPHGIAVGLGDAEEYQQRAAHRHQVGLGERADALAEFAAPYGGDLGT